MDVTALSPRSGILNSIRSIYNWFSSDPRHYQILFQITFLVYGYTLLNWDVSLMKLNITLLTTMMVQGAWIHFKGLPWSGLKSSLISGLSLCLMFQANSIWTLVLAAALAIISKFIFRINGKHIFNPTNFGMLAAILITGDAWISPGQWGSEGMVLFLVGITGLIVLLRVKRLETAFGFLLTFLTLSFFRHVIYQGWPVDFFFHQLNAGSLLLFSFFMITDPMATPSSQKVRLIWSAITGALAFLIATKLFVHTAPIWALFFMSIIVPVLDKYFPGNKFQWIK